VPKNDPVKATISSDEERKKEFLAQYEALCKKFGLNLAASPQFVQRDDGTYSLVVQWVCVPLPIPNGA
jgi:hypothetical protein